jgi:hypothetical protein
MGQVKVDFTDVEGGFDALPEGNYRGVIDSVENESSQRSGEPMVIIDYKVTEGKLKGTTAREYCSLQKQALFRLKQRLTAIGYEVPAGPFTFDTDDIVGTPVRIQAGPPRKYEDQMRTTILAVVLDDGGEIPETAEATPEPAVATPKKRPLPKGAGEDGPPGESPLARPTVAKPRAALKLERL